ncbi:MAG: GNAT family N-acetyltransferase [Candidatus Woesearchaeota archaeon]
MNITLRRHKLSDAKRFYEILTNPNFTYFSPKPKSVEEEYAFLKKLKGKWKEGIQRDYAIIHNTKVIGGCGLKFDIHRKFCAEVGYFVDEAYWGNGIAGKVVSLLEKEAKKLGIKRMTLITHTKNRASIRVAEKAGYKREGKMKDAIEHKKGFHDAYLFAKIL